MPKLSQLPAHFCRRLQTGAHEFIVGYEFKDLEKDVNEIQASPSVGQFAGKPDEPRYSPLEKAVKRNDVPLVRALLDLGADPLIGGNHSPIVACILNENPGLLAMILDHPRCKGLDINQIFYGSDPLVVVAFKEFMKITENQGLMTTKPHKRLLEIWQVFQLLFTYPKTNHRKHHQSLLHLCCMALFKMDVQHLYEWVMMNYINTISELVSTGADCNQKNTDGETPILTIFYYAILPINKLPDQNKPYMTTILFQALLKLIPNSLYPIDLTVFKTYGAVDAPQLRYKTPLMLLIQPENVRPGNAKKLVLREIEKQAFEKIFLLRKQGQKSEEIQNILHEFLMAHVCIPPDSAQPSSEDKHIWEEAVKAIREIEERCLHLLSVVAVANPKTIKDCRFEPKVNEMLVQVGFNLDGTCQQQLPPNNRTLLDWAVVAGEGIVVPSIINIFEGVTDQNIKNAWNALWIALKQKKSMNMLRSLLIYAFSISDKPEDFEETYVRFLFHAVKFNRYDLTYFLLNLFHYLPDVKMAHHKSMQSLIWESLSNRTWKDGTIMSVALQKSQDVGDLLLEALKLEMMRSGLFALRTELFNPSKSSKHPSTPSDGNVAAVNPVVDVDDTLKGILNLGKQTIQREAQGCLPNDAAPESVERVQKSVVKPLFCAYIDRMVKLRAFHEREPKSSAAHSVRRQLDLVDHIFSFVGAEGVSEESRPAQLARQKFNTFCFEAFKRHNAGRFVEKRPTAAPTKASAGQTPASADPGTKSAMQTETEGAKSSKRRCIRLQKASDI